MKTVYKIDVPGVKVISPNANMHYMEKARHTKAVRNDVLSAMRWHRPPNIDPERHVIKLTRIRYPRGKPMDGHDNLIASFKPAVDGIVDAMIDIYNTRARMNDDMQLRRSNMDYADFAHSLRPEDWPRHGIGGIRIEIMEGK